MINHIHSSHSCSGILALCMNVTLKRETDSLIAVLFPVSILSMINKGYTVNLIFQMQWNFTSKWRPATLGFWYFLRSNRILILHKYNWVAEWVNLSLCICLHTHTHTHFNFHVCWLLCSWNEQLFTSKKTKRKIEGIAFHFTSACLLFSFNVGTLLKNCLSDLYFMP